MRTTKILRAQPKLGLPNKTVADITLHNIDLATRGNVYNNEHQCSQVIFLARMQYSLSSGVNSFSLFSSLRSSLIKEGSCNMTYYTQSWILKTIERINKVYNRLSHKSSYDWCLSTQWRRYGAVVVHTTKIYGAQPEPALPNKTVADITLHNIDLTTTGTVNNHEP